VKPTKAFSLLEIITVVAIISIVTVISVPSYSNIKSQLDIRGTSNNLIGDLRNAQSDATTSQLLHCIRFNQASNPTSYSLIKINDDSTETIIRTQDIETNLKVEINVINNQFVFKSDSTPIHSGNITLNSPTGITKTIVINPIGTIRQQ
jgi:prepilin-type N-terminal cleavage/methylation domain-containing protein